MGGIGLVCDGTGPVLVVSGWFEVITGGFGW